MFQYRHKQIHINITSFIFRHDDVILLFLSGSFFSLASKPASLLANELLPANVPFWSLFPCNCASRWFPVQLCPRVWTSLENGRVAAKPPGPPVEGTTLHYSCHAGFILEGRNMTHCTKLGKWDAPKPTCLCEYLTDDARLLSAVDRCCCLCKKSLDSNHSQTCRNISVLDGFHVRS